MKLRPILLAAVVASSASCLNDKTEQKPLASSTAGDQSAHVLAPLNLQIPRLDSAKSLNFSSSAPHLFASAANLLQQWSNTIFPNGQTLAVVEVPPYVMMYHGRLDAETPQSPEWLAFDVEMAYGIMGSTRSSYLLTFQTTRRIKCLYFDGESATLMGQGQLDTQMLHIYGNTSGPAPVPGSGDDGRKGRHPGSGLLDAEYARATGLCNWIEREKLGGRGWGVEGVVRMNAGFELIWCDFMSTSLELMSRLNVSAPLMEEVGDEAKQSSLMEDATDVKSGPVSSIPMARESPAPSPTSEEEPSDVEKYYPIPAQPTRTDRSAEPTGNMPPPHWRQAQGEPFLDAQAWGWFLSATYHYGSTRHGLGRGEERLSVVGCGVASYYSPILGNSKVQLRVDEKSKLNLAHGGRWTGEHLSLTGQEEGLLQLGRRRRRHNLGNATASDAEAIRHLAADMIRRALESDRACSGVDWIGITHEVVQRTAAHLKAFEAMALGFPAVIENATAVAQWMHDLRGLSHMYMVPFLEYPSMTSSPEALDHVWSMASETFKAAFTRCKLHYTRRLVGRRLVAEEEHMRWAVEETTGAICSVLLEVGFEVEKTALDGRVSKIAEVLRQRGLRWQRAVAELRAWLGWEGEYLACEQACAWDERCYIPMWPMIPIKWGDHRPGGSGGPKGPERRPQDGHRGLDGGSDNALGQSAPTGPPSFMASDETDLWQPKCIKSSFFKSR
ncbi:hypothetical protein CFIMG_004196RA [Ceratocystis fimbriata CBS 114723]|uniref:Uncharacterized protein n=1 Tax=Ceratocystis fimbriata CBS 114723 TaxID=1035309 RepID=A0A2C5WZ66_9PEZI|nr:hypothetical protein CFIMG_004196RA [Ceratocystis fimbriata CBS 114723]